jgi:cell division protein FtsB
MPVVKRRTSIAVAPRGVTPRKRRRRVETVFIVIGCLLLADALMGERGLVAMARARQDLRVTQARLDAAQLEHQRLIEWLQRLQHDPETIEDEARRELGLIKPGEKVFTITDVPPGSQTH